MVPFHQVGIAMLAPSLARSINVDALCEIVGIPRAKVPDALWSDDGAPLLERTDLRLEMSEGSSCSNELRLCGRDGLVWGIQTYRIPTCVESENERFMVAIGPLVREFNIKIARNSNTWPNFVDVVQRLCLEALRYPSIGPELSLMLADIFDLERRGHRVASLCDYLWPVQSGTKGQLQADIKGVYRIAIEGPKWFLSVFKPGWYGGGGWSENEQLSKLALQLGFRDYATLG
jgi:hypothetical protein